MKIAELHLQTTDLSKQRDFYADTLCLPARVELDRLSVQAGTSRLVFTRAHAGWRGVYHFAFNIPQDRFDEARSWLSRRVPLLTNSAGADTFSFENWNSHSLYYLDAAGNILELIARHNLANGSSEPFSERTISSISEIGLATGDVEQTVQLLQTRLDAGVYDGLGSDLLTAVGDEDGLLIVVKEGRVWFPDTGQPAQLLPVTLLVSSRTNEERKVVGPPYRVLTP